jgi:hypothetical protein
MYGETIYVADLDTYSTYLQRLESSWKLMIATPVCDDSINTLAATIISKRFLP